MKKVIVTGSAGFIGKALVKRLLKEGVEVIGLDKKYETDIKVFKRPYEIPINISDIQRVFKFENGIDTVFHLAAETSVFNENQFKVSDTNILGFIDVSLACATYGCKLVYASSSCAANGNATSIYGLSKRFNEDYASIYIPTATGIRFHNVYGSDPRQGTLLWHLLNDEKVKLYNNGENRRHFTYIDDIVDAILYAATSDKPLLNAYNPELTSTRQFAEIVGRYKPLEIEFVREIREYDKAEQSIDNQIPVVPLRYTSVEIGLEKIFE